MGLETFTPISGKRGDPLSKPGVVLDDRGYVTSIGTRCMEQASLDAVSLTASSSKARGFTPFAAYAFVQYCPSTRHFRQLLAEVFACERRGHGVLMRRIC